MGKIGIKQKCSLMYTCHIDTLPFICFSMVYDQTEGRGIIKKYHYQSTKSNATRNIIYQSTKSNATRNIICQSTKSNATASNQLPTAVTVYWNLNCLWDNLPKKMGKVYYLVVYKFSIVCMVLSFINKHWCFFFKLIVICLLCKVVVNQCQRAILYRVDSTLLIIWQWVYYFASFI